MSRQFHNPESLVSKAAACCSQCGQPIPPAVSLPPIKQRIYDAIRHRPGIESEELRAIVWDGPDGGPENLKLLHAHVHQLNRQLLRFGICVRGSRFYGYRLQPIAAR